MPDSNFSHAEPGRAPRRLRILHVISGLDLKAGGTVTALIGMVHAQKQAGLDVSVVSTWRQGDELSAARNQLPDMGVHVDLVGPVTGPLHWHWSLRGVMQKLVAASDVVHIHAVWEDIQCQAARASRRQGVPHVLTPHGMLDPWCLAQHPLRKRAYMALRLRKMLNGASAIHYTSVDERRLTEQATGIRTRAIIEPNGLNFSEFRTLPRKGSFREKYPVIADRPLLLFLGRLHPKKGLELLIPALAQAQLPEVALAIVGPSDASYRAHVERMVETHGLSNRTVFTGPLYGEDRIAAMVDADLFALPSYQENFGIAVIEALAAGCPVIVSDQVNIHGEISAGQVGGVVPMDVGALSKALGQWLGDEPARRDAAAQRARSFVWDRYDWEHIARRWRDHYCDLARGPVDGAICG